MADHEAHSERKREELIVVALEGLEARMAKLEAPKSPFKRLTENAGAAALFLGLLITISSVYDTFISKPRQDEIIRLSQFNLALNAAASTAEDLIKTQASVPPATFMALQSAALPQILNDVSTATALLADLDEKDVQIPQLEVLSSTALSAGDADNAEKLAIRAVDKKDVSSFLHADAQRNAARIFAATKQFAKARPMFEAALTTMGNDPSGLATRGFILGQWLQAEYFAGDCAVGTQVFQRFLKVLQSPEIDPAARGQLADGTSKTLAQLQGQHCPLPDNFNRLSN